MQILSSFYTDSPYANYIKKEEDDDSYGLIFNEFVHEFGTILEVDIIYKQLDKSNWLLADNRHMQITLQKDKKNEQLQFTPKTSQGEQLIFKMSEQLLQDNKDYIQFH
ncbi:hypothetical protein [Bacillus sp. FJAT-45350]|uniref:hypothetical protein n=1 Tax=Bacillus sp. FJAT-45350 TaxID=2011014 RepID=UPI0011550EF2|nr:hypothetical protein [Bacillus sp. FJAT-45350]